MTSTVQVTSHGAHSLIQLWDSEIPGRRTLVHEVVVDPGDVETAHIWPGRELVITEIRPDHPLVTGNKPPAQPLE